MIHPGVIQTFVQTGTGNMGVVTDKSSPARFAIIEAERFVLAAFRVRWTVGTGTAEFALRIDNRLGTNFDFEPITRAGCGTTGVKALEWRASLKHIYQIMCHRYRTDQDILCFTWPNPDTGNADPDDDMRWAIAVDLIDVAKLEAFGGRLS